MNPRRFVVPGAAGTVGRIVVRDLLASHPRNRVVCADIDEGRVRAFASGLGSRRFGASLEALNGLAATLGYSLVGCESHGANAFFVRDDIVAERLPGAETRVSRLYRSPKYLGDYFGHPSRRDRSGLNRYEPRA